MTTITSAVQSTFGQWECFSTSFLSATCHSRLQLFRNFDQRFSLANIGYPDHWPLHARNWYVSKTFHLSQSLQWIFIPKQSAFCCIIRNTDQASIRFYTANGSSKNRNVHSHRCTRLVASSQSERKRLSGAHNHTKRLRYLRLIRNLRPSSAIQRNTTMFL